MRWLTDKRGYLFLLCLCVVGLWTAGAPVHAADDAISWQTLPTRHTLIHFQSQTDLKKFNAHIDYADDHWRDGQGNPTSSPTLEQQIKTKVDAIFRRVQQILDMRKKVKTVNILLYSNRAQLRRAYELLFSKPCYVRAWYIYEHNTIYINIDDVHAGLLAHELAHSVIDHYLLIRPPRETAEILARYVDRHLKDHRQPAAGRFEDDVK